jgi:hypothetical protein
MSLIALRARAASDTAHRADSLFRHKPAAIVHHDTSDGVLGGAEAAWALP